MHKIFSLGFLPVFDLLFLLPKGFETAEGRPRINEFSPLHEATQKGTLEKVKEYLQADITD